MGRAHKDVLHPFVAAFLCLLLGHRITHTHERIGWCDRCGRLLRLPEDWF